VDFTFKHQGRVYRVWRQPSYERRKLRGTGIVVEKEKAVLYPEGDTPIEGITQVNNAIKELLRIDDKQFKQIAMIAQGEFWQLLNAKTEQRTEILRTIFSTSAYKNIEYRLKDRMDASYKVKSKTEDSVVQYFGDVTADEEDALCAELRELQDRARRSQSAWNIDELLNFLGQLIEADKSRLRTVQSELKEAEEKLNKDKEALAVAETNNHFIERLQSLEKEKEELAGKRQDIDELEALLKRQKAATREVYPVYNTWKTKSDEVIASGTAIDEKKTAVQEAEKHATEAAQILKEAESHREEAEKLQKKIDKIAEEKSKYQQRDQLTKELAELREEKDTMLQRKSDLADEEKALKTKIKDLKKITADLKSRPVELADAKENGKGLKILLEDIDGIIGKKIPDRAVKQKKLAEKQAAYSTVFAAYEEATQRRIKTEKLLDNCRAGILAKGLEDGQKCPVCGSVHHPEPAVLPESSVSEEEFKKLQKRELEAQEKKASANTDAEKAKSELEIYEEQLRIDILDCLENDRLKWEVGDSQLEELIVVVGKARADADGSLKENTKLQNTLSKDCEKLEKSQTALEQAQGEESERLAEEKEELQKKMQDTESVIAERDAVLSTLRQLSFKDWETACVERDSAVATVTEIRDRIAGAETAKQEADEQLTSQKSSLKTMQEALKKQKSDEKNLHEDLMKTVKAHGFKSVEEVLTFVVSEDTLAASDKRIQEYNQSVATNQKQLVQAKADAKGKKPVNAEFLKETCTEQTEKVNLIRKSANTIENRMKTNSEKQENITDRKGMLESAQKEYNICARLYNLVKGTIGNGKITLEQYIQAAGFDGIIAAANRRLIPMSDNQYELYRQEDSLGKRSNTFLDLEVLDNYTGHRRPVGNLSGGESFKASLSLALGLSDTVAANIGGIQMDALFVDEGFGTLDRKSIDGAMEILNNLSQANRLVGIISHREELMENIPQQIKVKKTKEGSQLTFETGV